jgi:t-SNARE complex subunit (syntaxin)
MNDKPFLFPSYSHKYYYSITTKHNKIYINRKRENLVNTLTRKFIDEMKEYQNAQQAFKVNIRKKAVQQIKFVKEDATPEEVEEIMKSDGGREGLYQQSILQGGVNESIK